MEIPLVHRPDIKSFFKKHPVLFSAFLGLCLLPGLASCGGEAPLEPKTIEPRSPYQVAEFDVRGTHTYALNYSRQRVDFDILEKMAEFVVFYASLPNEISASDMKGNRVSLKGEPRQIKTYYLYLVERESIPQLARDELKGKELPKGYTWVQHTTSTAASYAQIDITEPRPIKSILTEMCNALIKINSPVFSVDPLTYPPSTLSAFGWYGKEAPQEVACNGLGEVLGAGLLKEKPFVTWKQNPANPAKIEVKTTPGVNSDMAKIDIEGLIEQE